MTSSRVTDKATAVSGAATRAGGFIPYPGVAFHMDSDNQSDANSYYSRRAVLTIGAGGLATALSGCQAFSSSDNTPMLDLIVNNNTPEPQEVEVEVIDPDKGNSEALVYELSKDSGDSLGEDIEIPADSEQTFEAVAEDDRYTIRAAVDQPDDNWRHYHYTTAPVDYDAQVFVLINRLEETGRDVIRFGPGPL